MGKGVGIRKPVSPNELLQLPKTNKSAQNKLDIKNNEKQNIESPKQKVKAPNVRPNFLVPKNLIDHFQIVPKNQVVQIGMIVQNSKH